MLPEWAVVLPWEELLLSGTQSLPSLPQSYPINLSVETAQPG